MLLVKLIDYLIERRQLVLRTGYAVLVLAVIIDALPFIVDKSKAHSALEHIPGFWGVFGFIGCVGLILAAKRLGALGILKREDFYHD